MNRGIHSRGYLPHWDFKNSVQGITFRLFDSVPKDVILKWKRELEKIEDEVARKEELHRKISRYEDVGMGECLLGIAEVAGIVCGKLHAEDGCQYKLLEWCVMPNHVHVLIKLLPDHSLSDIVQKWKGGSSMEINCILKRSGALWAVDYYDRFVRDEDDYFSCRNYIRMNPVKVGLCENPEDWEFSSAWKEERGL
ncbi:MAG: transposase [Verrucomicrobia bacterium]|nr:transposase [Verrucomicrobiota bacterium]|tara:strand:+ start:34107 stop:34691 length:585 start_codon:yes stop_codon:yes gene_type:complete